MCDYSLQNVTSRAAVVGDKLITRFFNTGTRGFTDVANPGVAVCLLPGTEVAFDAPVKPLHQTSELPLPDLPAEAVFAQVNKNEPRMHHDALEFPNGGTILLNNLMEGQTATVLQLPAMPKTEAEADEQRRAEYAG